VIIERKWAMPNRHTFLIKPIQNFVLAEIAGKDVVNRAARRAARMIWEDCLGRNSLKFVLRDTSSATKYKEILPAWVNIIKREILGE